MTTRTYDEMVDVLGRGPKARVHARIATLPLSFAVKFIVEDLDPAMADRLDLRVKSVDGRSSLDLAAIRTLYSAEDFPLRPTN